MKIIASEVRSATESSRDPVAVALSCRRAKAPSAISRTLPRTRRIPPMKNSPELITYAVTPLSISPIKVTLFGDRPIFSNRRAAGLSK